LNERYPNNIELLATKHIRSYTECGCKEILIERARALKNDTKNGEWKFSIPREHPVTFVNYTTNYMINISCIIEGKKEEIIKHNMELQVYSYIEKKKIFEFHIDLKNPKAKVPEPLNHLHVLGFDVPRFPYPPMDIVLLCEFVLINFFPEESNKLRKDPSWKNLVRNSQKMFIEPYFERCQRCLDNEKETLMGHLISLT
jgi:hypothetical protein